MTNRGPWWSIWEPTPSPQALPPLSQLVVQSPSSAPSMQCICQVWWQPVVSSQHSRSHKPQLVPPPKPAGLIITKEYSMVSLCPPCSLEMPRKHSRPQLHDYINLRILMVLVPNSLNLWPSLLSSSPRIPAITPQILPKSHMRHLISLLPQLTGLNYILIGLVDKSVLLHTRHSFAASKMPTITMILVPLPSASYITWSNEIRIAQPTMLSCLLTLPPWTIAIWLRCSFSQMALIKG